MQKWRNSDVHQSVEQKYQLVRIGFLVSLLEPKIDHFSSFGPDTLKNEFSKKNFFMFFSNLKGFIITGTPKKNPPKNPNKYNLLIEMKL